MPEMIRKPNPDETTQVQGMWVDCFPDGGPGFVDWYFTQVYRPEWTLALFDGAELLSNLQMIPYTLLFRGRGIPMDTLTGVATGEAHRNRGLARSLMAESLRDMAARGRGFTFLYPFSHPFYQRLGWETCSLSQELLLPAADLPSAPPEGWQARPAAPDIAVLAGIYDRFMAGYHCRSVRDGALWRKRIGENGACDGFILLAYDRGEPAGYAFCEEQEGEISIGEFACARVEAVPSLLAALAPMGRTVCLTAPADFRAYLLPGRWKDRVKLQPHVMFRVTDVVLAFSQAAPACEGELVLRVHSDNMRRENNGVYRVCASGGAAEAERTDAPPRFTCGVGTLARILTGFADAGEAVDAGLAVGDAEAVGLLRRMYPKQTNYLFELY